MPTYLKYWPLQKVSILSMPIFSILRSYCLKSTDVNLSWNIIYVVFDAFRVNLFALNQSEISLRLELTKLFWTNVFKKIIKCFFIKHIFGIFHLIVLHEKSCEKTAFNLSIDISLYSLSIDILSTSTKTLHWGLSIAVDYL